MSSLEDGFVLLVYCLINYSTQLSLFNFTASSLDKLKSEAHVTIPVEVKFVNRTRREVQLEWINPQGRREKRKVLAKGRCWRTTSWEGHYWVCCDPKHDQHLFALNYGLHYRAHKTRRLRERVVITAGMGHSTSKLWVNSDFDHLQINIE